MTSPPFPSDKYQDYVISDGKYVGRFEEMYQRSAEIPWHQDEHAKAIWSDIAIAILRRREIKSMLDVGCGLGYLTARMKNEIQSLERVVALDISDTAIARARRMFSGIEFYAATLSTFKTSDSFDVVVSKDVLWYVLDDLHGYFASLARHSCRWLYIGQSFPECRPFFGDHLLPDAAALGALIERLGYRIDYSVVERDATYGGREYAHIVIAV